VYNYTCTFVLPQLSDILKDPEPFKLQAVTSDTMSEFNRSSKISLKGKFGAELTKEILGKCER